MCQITWFVMMYVIAFHIRVVTHDSDHWLIGVASSHMSLTTFVLDVEDSEAPLGHPQLLSQAMVLTVVVGVSQD
jgi:hypothetical protein